MIKANGIATISSSVTGIVYEIKPDELDWQATGSEDRSMGLEFIYEAFVQMEDHENGKVVSCTWTASEYPVGVLAHVNAVVQDGNLEKDFSFHWEHQSENL